MVGARVDLEQEVRNFFEQVLAVPCFAAWMSLYVGRRMQDLSYPSEDPGPLRPVPACHIPTNTTARV